MQDADAARRLAILRGESPPPPLPDAEPPADPSDKKYTRRDRDRDGNWLGGARKRKRAGEDDTDFEMRVARERAEVGARVAGELGAGEAERSGRKGRDDVDIVDSRGHIDLVGAPPRDAGEHEDKRREVADRHAIGALKGDFADDPWYADAKRRRINTTTDSSTALVLAATATTTEDRLAERGMEAPTKNVWGRDDPKRRGRETARLDANDPLAAMKSGAKKVRDIVKERRRDAEERGRELEQLRQEERRREKRRKREKKRADEDKYEDGSLRESHRSGRSERRNHGDERREGRSDDVHREERRRHRETEHSRDREKDRHHRRDRDRSRERGSSSRSHRYKDRDDGHDHRGKDHRRREREV